MVKYFHPFPTVPYSFACRARLQLPAFREVAGTIRSMNSHESEALRQIEQSLREQDPALADMLSSAPVPPRKSRPVAKASWFARLEARAAERWARRTGRSGR